MRILLVTDDLLPGGTARFVISLANDLHVRGYDVTVASSTGEFKRYLNSSIRFVQLYLRKQNSTSINVFGIIISIIRLWMLLNFNRFDIIHSHKRLSHFLVHILLWRTKVKHITHYASVFRSKKIFTKFGQMVLCCSDAVRQNLIDSFMCPPDIAFTIYHGINPLSIYNSEQKQNLRATLMIRPNEKIISSVGQFVPMKDRENLIRSIALLRKRIDINNVIFFLLGYGTQEQYLKELVKEFQLQETIRFLRGTFDVEALINISEFMVLNSTQEEGFGIVLLEAASIGKMHIGTKAGGIPEFIEHERNGLLVEQKNQEQLSDAIEYCIKHPDMVEKMGIQAQKKYQEYFTFQRMMNEMILKYKQVCMP